MADLFQTLLLNDSIAELGPEFSVIQTPTPIPEPYLVATSPSSLGLCDISAEQSQSQAFVDIFSGNRLPSHWRPRSTVYSGHQFGVWAGQLGDGRAIFLGELNGYEIQLKGSGLTPFSRMGDGRAVLRSSVREFLCSEAMVSLGVPTTRALCIIGSDMPVFREQPEPAAVVTRLTPSFIRFGTFEHWFYRGDLANLTKLADFVITRYFPQLKSAQHPYAALLTEVTRRTAQLMAHWQTVGFMHGVMNTDNMSILGVTLDYGPFGFMEGFDPQHICNHSDSYGRYAYHMQPDIALWNCYALGQAMLPLIGSVDDTKAALSVFESEYQTKVLALWRTKLGLVEAFDDDNKLVTAMLEMMAINRLDFTIFFRRLSHVLRDDQSIDNTLSDLCIDRDAFQNWMQTYRQRLKQENSDDNVRHTSMRQCNPKFVLRNYLAQKAIEAAEDHDFSEIEKLRQILSQPFDEQAEHEAYAALPPDWASGISVSCSS